MTEPNKSATQTYDQVPVELRDMLDQVYTREGVEVWWTAPHRQFYGWSARDLWNHGSSLEVLAAAERLLGQVAT